MPNKNEELGLLKELLGDPLEEMKEFDNVLDRYLKEAKVVDKKSKEATIAVRKIVINNKKLQEEFKKAMKGLKFEEGVVSKKTGRMVSLTDHLDWLKDLAEKAEKDYEEIADTLRIFSEKNINDVLKDMDKIDEKKIGNFINIFKTKYPKGNLNDFKDQLYDYIKLMDIFERNSKKFDHFKNIGFNNIENVSQFKEVIEYLEMMKKSAIELDRIANRSDFSGIFTKENGLELDVRIKNKNFIQELEDDLTGIFNIVLSKFGEGFKQGAEVLKQARNDGRKGLKVKKPPKINSIKNNSKQRFLSKDEFEHIAGRNKYISQKSAYGKLDEIIKKINNGTFDKNEDGKDKEDLIGYLANMLKVDKVSLDDYKAQKTISEDVKKIIDNLLGDSYYQDLFSKVKNGERLNNEELDKAYESYVKSHADSFIKKVTERASVEEDAAERVENAAEKEASAVEQSEGRKRRARKKTSDEDKTNESSNQEVDEAKTSAEAVEQSEERKRKARRKTKEENNKQEGSSTKTTKSKKQTSEDVDDPETDPHDASNYQAEIEKLDELQKAVNSVTLALNEKTKAIQAEEVQMDVSVNSEIAKLNELKNAVNEVTIALNEKTKAIKAEETNGIKDQVKQEEKLIETKTKRQKLEEKLGKKIKFADYSSNRKLAELRFNFKKYNLEEEQNDGYKDIYKNKKYLYSIMDDNNTYFDKDTGELYDNVHSYKEFIALKKEEEEQSRRNAEVARKEREEKEKLNDAEENIRQRKDKKGRILSSPKISEHSNLPSLKNNEETRNQIKLLEEELIKLSEHYYRFTEEPRFDFELEKSLEFAKELEEILTRIYNINPDYSVDALILNKEEELKSLSNANSEFVNILTEVRKGTKTWSYNKLLNDPNGFAKDLNNIADEYYKILNTENRNEVELLNVEAKFNAMLSSQHKLFEQSRDLDGDWLREMYDNIQSQLTESTSDLQDKFWDRMANDRNMSSQRELEWMVRDRLDLFSGIGDKYGIERLQDVLDLLKNIDKVRKSLSKESQISYHEKVADDNLVYAQEFKNRYISNYKKYGYDSDPEWYEKQYGFIAEFINKAEQAKARIAELKGEVYELKEVAVEDVKNDLLAQIQQQVSNRRKDKKGRTLSSPKISKHSDLPSLRDKTKAEQQEQSSAPSSKYQAEIGELERLQEAVDNVTIALNQKTLAIQAEEAQMDKSVNSEIAKLNELENKINEVKGNFFSDKNSVDPVQVKLIPDTSTFKVDAETELAKITLEKEVELTPDVSTFREEAIKKLDKFNLEKNVSIILDDKKINHNNFDYIVDNMTKEIIDEFNIVDETVQEKIRNLVSTLNNNLPGMPSRDADIFANTYENLGKVVIENANVLEKKKGIYEEFYNWFKNVDNIKVSDTIRKDLGDEWKNLTKQFVGKFTKTKGIAVDQLYGEMQPKFPDLLPDLDNATDQLLKLVEIAKLAKSDVDKLVKPNINNDYIEGVYTSLLDKLHNANDDFKEGYFIDILPQIDNEQWIPIIRKRLQEINNIENFTILLSPILVENFVGNAQTLIDSLKDIAEIPVAPKLIEDFKNSAQLLVDSLMERSGLSVDVMPKLSETSILENTNFKDEKEQLEGLRDIIEAVKKLIEKKNAAFVHEGEIVSSVIPKETKHISKLINALNYVLEKVKAIAEAVNNTDFSKIKIPKTFTKNDREELERKVREIEERKEVEKAERLIKEQSSSASSTIVSVDEKDSETKTTAIVPYDLNTGLEAVKNNNMIEESVEDTSLAVVDQGLVIKDNQEKTHKAASEFIADEKAKKKAIDATADSIKEYDGYDGYEYEEEPSQKFRDTQTRGSKYVDTRKYKEGYGKTRTEKTYSGKDENGLPTLLHDTTIDINFEQIGKAYIKTWKQVEDIRKSIATIDPNSEEWKEQLNQLNFYSNKLEEIDDQIKSLTANDVEAKKYLDNYIKGEQDLYQIRSDIKNARSEDERTKKIEALSKEYGKKLSGINNAFKGTDQYNKIEKAINNLKNTDDIYSLMNDIENLFNEMEQEINKFKQNVVGSNTLDPVVSAKNRYENMENSINGFVADFKNIGYSAEEAEEKVSKLRALLTKLQEDKNAGKINIWQFGERFKEISDEEQRVRKSIPVERKQKKAETQENKLVIEQYDLIINKLKQLKQAREKLAKLRNDAFKHPDLDYSKDIDGQIKIINDIANGLSKIKSNKFISDNAEILGKERIDAFEQAKYESQSAYRNVGRQEKLRENQKKALDLKKSIKSKELIELESSLERSGMLTEEVKKNIDDLAASLSKVSTTADLSNWNNELKLFKKGIDPSTVEKYNEIIDILDRLKKARLELARIRNDEERYPFNDYSKDIEHQEKLIDEAVNELSKLRSNKFISENAKILGEKRVKAFEQSRYEAQRAYRNVGNQERIREKKKAQTELNESIKEFNRLQKDREKTGKAENKNANAIIQEEIKALERLNELEIEATEARKKGQNTTDIQRKIDLEKEYIARLEEELEYYKETQAYKNKDSVFENKERELDAEYDANVNKGRLDFEVAENEAWALYDALEQVKAILNSIKDEKGLDDDDLVVKDATEKINALNDKLIKTKNIDSSTFINYFKNTRKILEDLNSVDFILSPNLNQEELTSEVADYIKIITNGQAKIEAFDYANNKIFVTFKDGQGDIRKVAFAYDSLTGALKRAKDEGRKTQSTFEKIFSFFVQKGKNLLGYLLSFASFHEIWQQIRQGVTYVRELNTALTEMRKVSDESVETLERFQKTSFDTANSIGTTAKQVQDSTSSFMRLGYELEEASRLAEDANIYANVGDMEIEEATEHMISSIKAWESEFESDVEASEAIVDRYNEIGNNFAISSADIGSAMERSAAALKAGGNTLNESLGLITAGNVIQQDAETTAAALKILSLRIRGSKSELEEMGEETDNLASSSSKLRDEIKALSGVDIMKDENTYKSTAQIIKELGAVYGKMSDVSQATLLEKIAGKNRASTVEGLLQNYEIIDQVIHAAENASGSALRENQKYIESIDGKIEKLTNSIQEFWSTVLDTDTVTWVLDSLTSIIQGVTDLIEKLGVLPSLIGTAGGAFGLFQAVSGKGGGRARNFVVISKLITHRSLIKYLYV